MHEIINTISICLLAIAGITSHIYSMGLSARIDVLENLLYEEEEDDSTGN